MKAEENMSETLNPTKIMIEPFLIKRYLKKREPTYVGSDSIARTGLGPVTDRI